MTAQATTAPAIAAPATTAALATKAPVPKLIEAMALEYGLAPDKFEACIRKTCMPANATNEEFCAFLVVAHAHKLNPLLREIYAFPKKGGGIQTVVPIDGWSKIVNRNEKYEGFEFEYHFDKDGAVNAITCTLYRNDKERPFKITEFMDECFVQNSGPWNSHPRRMLRHKAYIQCARIAFSLGGIMDEDEFENSDLKMVSGSVVNDTPALAEKLKAKVEAPARVQEVQPVLPVVEEQPKEPAPEAPAATTAAPAAELSNREHLEKMQANFNPDPAKAGIRRGRKPKVSTPEPEVPLEVLEQGAPKNTEFMGDLPEGDLPADDPFAAPPEEAPQEPPAPPARPAVLPSEVAAEKAAKAAADKAAADAIKAKEDREKRLDQILAMLPTLTNDDIRKQCSGLWKSCTGDQKEAALAAMKMQSEKECATFTPVQWKNFVRELVNAIRE